MIGQTIRDLLDEQATLAQELAEERAITNGVTAIASDAIDHLLRLGAYGLHESRRKELHQAALELAGRLKSAGIGPTGEHA